MITKRESPVTLGEKVRAAHAIKELMEHEGWGYLLEAIEDAKRGGANALLAASATNEGASYAEKIGEVRGISRLPFIAQRVVSNGRKAEEALREQEEMAGNG